MTNARAVIKSVTRGRTTADAAPGTVVFLIGVRINRPWKLDKWLPVFAPMPRVLGELRRYPDSGIAWRSTMVNRRLAIFQPSSVLTSSSS